MIHEISDSDTVQGLAKPVYDIYVFSAIRDEDIMVRHVDDVRFAWHAFIGERIREDDDRSTKPDPIFQIEQIFVLEPDASFCGSSSDRFRKVGPMDADTDITRYVQPKEPGTVCITDRTFSVPKVMGYATGIQI